MSSKTNKFLIALAAACLAVILAQSMISYGGNDLFSRCLLTALNTVRAFLLEAELSMGDMVAALPQLSGGLRVLAYAYVGALLLAPLCTAAAVLMALRRIFYGVRSSVHNLRAPRAVVFGDSPWGRSLTITAAKTYRTTCFIAEELPEEAELELLKANVRLLYEDAEQRGQQFRKCRLENASCVALMDLRETDNLAALHRLVDYLRGLPDAGGTAPITCLFLHESYETAQLARGYCDQAKRDEPALKRLELIPLDMSGQTVAQMLRECPLYTANIHDPALKEWAPGSAAPNPWDVHIAIAGFGSVGQQMLLQTLNMSVLHSSARIVIDVFDLNVRKQLDMFLRRFAVGTHAALQWDQRLGSTTLTARLTLPTEGSMDGSLTLRFFAVDVCGAAFEQALDDASAGMPITYAAICFGDSAIAVSTMLSIDEALRRQSMEHTPIVMYMDRTDGLRESLQAQSGTYAHVYASGSAGEALQPDQLAVLARDPYAIQFNARYDWIDLSDASKWSVVPQYDEQAAREHWQNKPAIKQESSRKLSAHQPVKKMAAAYYEWRQLGAEGDFAAYLQQYLSQARGTPPIISQRMQALFAHKETAAFVAALNADPILHEAAAMEHRRWTQAQLTMGYRYAPGKKNDVLRTNPCILSWDDLCEKLPEYCQYDLVPMLML